jgi:tritrans,polycis-undecaprenyl-diphosphate synthase [geranylgeranyl-diphosphate specific]
MAGKMLYKILSVIGVYGVYERWLRNQIDSKEKPSHVGVIMDGNRRWALSQNMIPWEGHLEGADKVEEFLDWCLELGVETVTLYSFSTENFNREEKEVQELMKLFERTLEEVMKSSRIHDNRVKVRAIGRINTLPQRLQELIHEVEEATKDYDRYYLNIAIAYGGRAEIVDALRKIASQVKSGEMEPEMIDEEVIEANLYTAHLPQPDPDLIIRTSGESRLSNFLVWQGAYSELFIVDVYWPAFRKIDLMRAIRSYQLRHRRYGK